MKSHFRKCAYVVTAVTLVGFASIKSAEAKTRLVVSCFWPAKHFVCQDLLPGWLEEVKEVTQGRVTGRILPKSVAKPEEQLAAVEKGLADVAIVFNGMVTNRGVIGPMVAMTPFTATSDAEAMSVALWETNRKYFAEEFKVAHLLSQWVISPGELFSQTDIPVNSMADLQARKIWSLPDTLATIMKNIGAGVVATPAVRSNEIISRGVVDAHIGLDPQAVEAFQLIPYTRSMTKFSKGIYATSFSFFISNDKWADLSEEDQLAIDNISGEKFARRAGALWVKSTQSALEAFEKQGLEVVQADPVFESEFKSAATPLTDEWISAAKAAGIDGLGAYDFYRSRVVEMSK